MKVMKMRESFYDFVQRYSDWKEKNWEFRTLLREGYKVLTTRLGGKMELDEFIAETIARMIAIKLEVEAISDFKKKVKELGNDEDKLVIDYHIQYEADLLIPRDWIRELVNLYHYVLEDD